MNKTIGRVVGALLVLLLLLGAIKVANNNFSPSKPTPTKQLGY